MSAAASPPKPSGRAPKNSGRKAARTRAYILEAASKVASVEGIDGLTIGRLAGSLSISKSGLYAHFGSKEALQIAVIDTIAERFHREVALPAFSYPSGKERLIAVMEYWLSWSQHPDRPGGCQLIAAAFEFDSKQGAVKDRLAKWINTWRATLTQIAAEALGCDHALIAARQLTTLMFGLYMDQHLDRGLLGNQDSASHALAQWRDIVKSLGSERSS